MQTGLQEHVCKVLLLHLIYAVQSLSQWQGQPSRPGLCRSHVWLWCVCVSVFQPRGVPRDNSSFQPLAP